MAGICMACKSTLHSTDLVAIANNSSSNTNGFVSDHRQVFCHHSCFVCSACNSPLQERFSISADEQLFCSKHCGNSEEELLRVLTDFKAKSLALKSALQQDSDQDAEAVEEPDKEGSCTCNKTQLVEPVAGYWVECVESNCLKSTSFLKDQDNRFSGSCDLGSSRIIERVTSVAPEEFYRQYFYGMKHWNYCVKDEEIGPVILSIKSDSTSHLKCHFRIIVRSSYYLMLGLLPVPNHHTSHSDHEEMVQLMARQMGLVSSLKLITAPSAPSDLLKMDTAFTKKAYKFGVVYMMEGQQTEEEMFGNKSHSKTFEEFLNLLGERVRLRGFNKYRAGLDGNNDLTGKYSVYTTFADKEIMFHVSTLLPFEETDPQKLQRKRHIGNDIVCIVFMDAFQTKFIPSCIKSNFLHSFIVVQVDFATNPDLYTVSVVSKDDVPLYGPPLSEKHTFQKNAKFRDWILRKLIQGEQACHRAPNFARLHARTRSQIMEQLLKKVEVSSGQKRPEDKKVHQHSLSLSGNQESGMIMGKVERDFSSAGVVSNRGDKVAFLVGSTNKRRFIAVRSVVARKSRVLCNMFFKDLTQGTASYQETPKADHVAPVVKRAISWTRFNPSLHAGLRSGKFNLEKIRRSKSDSDNTYNSVTLASVTDLENKNDDRLATTSPLHCQEIVIQEFEPDVFEAVLEFVHSGSCDLIPSLLPGLLCAAEHYKMDDLQHVCTQRLQQCISGQMACNILNYLDCYRRFPWADVVREKIVELVSHVSPSILHCIGFADLSEESVQLILSRSHLVSKTVLFQSILEWAKTYSKKSGCERSVQELAQPLIHKIVNTQQISAHELQEVVQLSGLVPNDAVNLALTVKMARDSITDTHC